MSVRVGDRDEGKFRVIEAMCKLILYFRVKRMEKYYKEIMERYANGNRTGTALTSRGK